MPRSKKQLEQDQRARRRKQRLRVVMVLLVVVAALGYAAARFIAADTQMQLTTSAGTTKTFQGTQEANQRFDEATFSLSLPADWQKTTPEQTIYAGLKYKSTKKQADNRFLTVYVDRIPADRAVNKVLAVREATGKLTPGTVSEQCSDFPEVQKTGVGKLAVQASWDGVPFVCDLDAITRNVVGTSSPGAVNAFTLTGPKAGTHRYFFVYEDNNYTPEYNILYTALKTFQAK